MLPPARAGAWLNVGGWEGTHQFLSSVSTRTQCDRLCNLKRRMCCCFHQRRVCLSVLASSAILDESSVASAQSGAVVSQLVGKKVVQLSRECSAVPLLHPITHNLPFAASLQIFSDSSSQGSASSVASSTMPLSSRQHVSSGSLVELHYVISGKGPAVPGWTGVAGRMHMNGIGM